MYGAIKPHVVFQRDERMADGPDRKEEMGYESIRKIMEMCRIMAARIQQLTERLAYYEDEQDLVSETKQELLNLSREYLSK